MSDPRRADCEVSGLPELRPDFEARVFARIASRKRQRRVLVSTSLVFAVAGFLFFWQTLTGRLDNRPDQRAQVRPPEAVAAKTEVPVSEYLTFASSDGQTNYSLERRNRRDAREF